jgi:hypothetical protein
MYLAFAVFKAAASKFESPFSFPAHCRAMFLRFASPAIASVAPGVCWVAHPEANRITTMPAQIENGESIFFVRSS